MNAPKRARILLIDDDADIGFAVQAILAQLDYEVAYCATGPAGMEAVRRERPALVLLDIMLSHPTEGLQVACQMRQDPQLKDIPIVFMSAMDEGSEQVYAREVCPIALDADMFLEKPLDAVTLRDAVEWVLRQISPPPNSGS